MNNKLSNGMTRMYADLDNRRAAHLLEKIASDDDWGTALTHGCQRHGSAFIAFLLVPYLNENDPHHIVPLFDEAFVLSGRDEKDALKLLLQRTGWEEKRTIACHEIAFKDCLTWDEKKLMEYLDEHYAFVSTHNGCFVFDNDMFDTEQFEM